MGDLNWYYALQGRDYDPSKFTYGYDTSSLVDGYMEDDSFTPWVSKKSGYDPNRYKPTTGYGAFGREGSHFNFTKGVEESPYYKKFGEDLFDQNGQFTEVGTKWARAVDALLPPGSKATFFDENGNLRSSWSTSSLDAHNRDPKTFNNLYDYANWIRNDQILGARHNVFLNTGNRYFYIDKDGNKHWVDPKLTKYYKVSKDPVEQSWNDDKTVYWKDYQLTGLGLFTPPAELPVPDTEFKGTISTRAINVGPLSNKRGRYEERNKEGGYGFDWKAVGDGIQKIFGNPNLIGFGRLAGNLINNERVYDEALKGINPVLRQSYHTHRQVVGDEATKQAYYRRAAQGQTRAAQAFTSDADRQMAYQFEAKRVGDELRAQGDLADNQEIRRTSDESNQHQWANTQRDTEVANANIASINQANSLRHNLLAQKHAAQWSSIDNYLQGVEYRAYQKQEKDKAIADEIWQLNRAWDVENDPEMLSLKEEYEAAIKDPKNQKKIGEQTVIDYDSPVLRGIRDRMRKAQYRLKIETAQIAQRRNAPSYVKSGGKITHKRKDDLLYKSTRDVVTHFRKMSKIASDAQNRKTPKIEKLTPHPKKYQQGGIAPFTIYKPIALGGETSRTYETSSNSSRSSSKSSSSGGNNDLDLLKKLFEAIQVEGLPSDTNVIYAMMNQLMRKKEFFGTELSTDDIATMYIQQMQYINKVKFNKKEYDQVSKSVSDKNANSEYAIDSHGRLVVQNTKTGKIELKSWNEIKDNLRTYNPLTNDNILKLRANDPSSAFNDSLLEIASNATSMSEIAKFLNSYLPRIEGSNSIEGYTSSESNMIKQGIQVLKDSYSGKYKYTDTNNKQQAEAALKYIYSILPDNMKQLLEVKSDISKVTGANDRLSVKDLLVQAISSKISENFSIDYESDPNAKSKRSSGSGETGEEGQDVDYDKINTNPLIAMISQDGGSPIRLNIITSKSKMSVDGTSYPYLPNITEEMSVDKMLYDSKIIGITQGNKRGITFGDQKVNPENLKDIMYVNNGGVITTLPCKIVDGSKQVNLAVKDAYEKAEKEAYKIVGDRSSDKYKKVLGQKLHDEHLDSLLDHNGLPNTDMFSEFLIVEAYTTDRIPLNKDSQYIEKVRNPNEALETRISQALSTDDKKTNYEIDVDDNGWIEGGSDTVYRANVFIPINNNFNAAMIAWDNSNLKLNQQEDLERLYQNYYKSKRYNSNTGLND